MQNVLCLAISNPIHASTIYEPGLIYIVTFLQTHVNSSILGSQKLRHFSLICVNISVPNLYLRELIPVQLLKK